MKRSTVSLRALAVLTAIVGLAGCGDKRIAEVKALPFSYPSDNVQDPNMTVDQALDYRKLCASVKWKVDETEQHQTFVQYTCTYKGVKNSAFIAKSKWQQPASIPADSAGDVYQWIYGADGKPTPSYVAMHYQYANGTANDTYTGSTSQATALMKEAVNNTAEDYDHLLSDLGGGSIPPPVAELVAQAAALKAQEDASKLDECVKDWTHAYAVRQYALGRSSTASQDQINEWQGFCVAGRQAPVITDGGWRESDKTRFALAGKVYAETNTEITPFPGGVDRTSFALPVWIGKEDLNNYPIYAVTCQFDKQVCESTDAANNPIQISVKDVAAKLSEIRNTGILNHEYTCRFTICSNSDGAIVGRASDDMVKFIPELGQ